MIHAAHLTYDVDGVVEHYGLDGEVTTIGRHPDRELQLLDRSVDKLHATVVCRRGVFLLEAHGVVKIGDRVASMLAPTALLDGDVITLGGRTLVFQLPRLLPHGGVPADLAMLPLGGAVSILRIEHTVASERLDAVVLAALAPGHGDVVARSALHLEIMIDTPGRALAMALGLVPTLRALTLSGGHVRIGADLAPLEEARAGAARAVAASDGHLVATDSFTGRGMLDAILPERDVLWARLAPDPTLDAALFMIASD